jgi:hypothetical protein
VSLTKAVEAERLRAKVMMRLKAAVRARTPKFLINDLLGEAGAVD